MDVSIRQVRDTDAADIARIYNGYVRDTCITFETDPLDAWEMAQRIAETRALALPWLVAETSGQILGYAYASKWKGRCAYRFAVETTVYLDPAQAGRGIGATLYDALIAAVRACSMHVAIGGIALPNEASVRLHERLGFRKVGHFEQVGFKQDRWVDVGYWQLMLDA
jgi:L-amino acid N-acyltransferase YncA